MQWFANLPFEFRVSVIALLGLFVIGPFSTWAIASWSYFGERLSVWSVIPEGVTWRRAWYHYLPIVGWISRIGEGSHWGRWFWVRPFLIEVMLPIGIVALYVWEMDRVVIPNINAANVISNLDLHWQFLGHMCLIPLLVTATFIDFDEMLIPDMITVPGTLLAMVGASLIPQWHLWIIDVNGVVPGITQLSVSSPQATPAWFHSLSGLLAGIAMFLAWCFALADRRVILRRGYRKAIAYFFAALIRRPIWKMLVAIAVVGSGYIAMVYAFFGPAAWLSLFSSLCGIAIGGGLVWFIRIVASLAMRVEALGFGDVLLMSMVGAFLGWQPVGVSFFYAPLFALPIVLGIAIVTGQAATPFGPYLCIATAYCLVRWDAIWNRWLQPVLDQFGGMWRIVVLFVAMVMLMGTMLAIYRMVKGRLVRS